MAAKSVTVEVIHRHRCEERVAINLGGETTQYSDVTHSVFQTDNLFYFLILTHPSPVSTLLCFNEHQKCVNDFKLDRCL